MDAGQLWESSKAGAEGSTLGSRGVLHVSVSTVFGLLLCLGFRGLAIESPPGQP